MSGDVIYCRPARLIGLMDAATKRLILAVFCSKRSLLMACSKRVSKRFPIWVSGPTPLGSSTRGLRDGEGGWYLQGGFNLCHKYGLKKSD